MPMYEFQCRDCGVTFEALRPVEEADAPVRCPQGHTDAVRSLSLIARPASGDGASTAGGGACCAAGCACGAN